MSILGEFGLPPPRLMIELTESDIEAAQDILSSLRVAGITIAVDDFGTGYFSLYHLRKFKLDILKIDRSFVHAMESEPESLPIVKAIIGLGKGLDLTVIAEGIQAASQRDALVEQGCRLSQGFLFGKAVPAEAARAFFAPDLGGGTPAAIRT